MRKLIIWLVVFVHLITFSSLLLAVEVTYYDTNNVGTPVVMWDSSGKKVWETEYYPFGQEYQTSSVSRENSHKFIGKEKDKETGLSYFGARYYDDHSSRFLTPDPVRPVDALTSKTDQKLLDNPQRLNRYAYGLNNPYRYIDPDGEFAFLIPIAIASGEALGGLAGHIVGATTVAGITAWMMHEGDNDSKVDPEKVKKIKEGTGKGNNVEVESQKEAEALIEKARPELEWKKTYEKPKYKAGKELHPSDGSGVDKPHIKWKDWSNGKQKGSEGHIYFPKVKKD